jgi:hypothetical protein
VERLLGNAKIGNAADLERLLTNPKIASLTDLENLLNNPKLANVADAERLLGNPKIADVAELERLLGNPKIANLTDLENLLNNPKLANVADAERLLGNPKIADVAELERLLGNPKIADVAELERLLGNPKIASLTDLENLLNNPKLANVAELEQLLDKVGDFNQITQLLAKTNGASDLIDLLNKIGNPQKLIDLFERIDDPNELANILGRFRNVDVITDPNTGLTLPKEFIESLEQLGISRDTIFERYFNNLQDGANFQDLISDFVLNNPQGLNFQDAHAIYGYTTNVFYRALNSLLRDAGKTPEAGPITDMINAALAKLPPLEGTQYRGIRELEGDALTNFLTKHQEGNVVTYDDFISAGNSQANAYWDQSKIRVTIENATDSRDITDLAFGVHFHETIGKGANYAQETIFMSGTQFIVKSIEPQVVNGRTVYNLVLEQIPSSP